MIFVAPSMREKAWCSARGREGDVSLSAAGVSPACRREGREPARVTRAQARPSASACMHTAVQVQNIGNPQYDKLTSASIEDELNKIAKS